jgi:anti-sigma regulatory factor (Ser/Thr protein kinase)
MSDERHGCEFDRDALQVAVRRRVPGRLDALSPAVEEVMAEVRRVERARGKEFEIETSLREALANAIRHGCDNDSAKSVEL